jgi:hypothetical protein
LPPRQDAFDEKEIRHLIDLLDNAERCLSPWPIGVLGIELLIRRRVGFECPLEFR